MSEDHGFSPNHLMIFLENLKKIQSSGEIMLINEFEAGDQLKVFTLNTCYVLKIIDQEDGLVEAISNGQLNPFPRKFRVLGPVAVGYSLFLEATERNDQNLVETIATSKVQRIAVNGKIAVD